MTRHYATACRARELPVLVASMRRHCGDFVLHALAWDYHPPADADDLRFTLRNFFLRQHPDYAPERLPGPQRRPVDEVVTMRWRFFADVMQRTGQPLTMIDGDLFFLVSPEPVFAEIGSAPLAVTPHRIPPRSAGLPGVVLETHACYGRHNAGFVYAAITPPIREMAAATYLWSYTEVVPRPGRRPLFGDQSALEDVAERFEAHEIAAAANIGPWSVHNEPIERGPGGEVLFGGRPLISYHFSSLRVAPEGAPSRLADPHYEVERAPGAVELLYEPYLRELREG